MLVKKLPVLKFIKYSFIGVFCTGIYFLCMYLFVELWGEKPVFSAMISFIIMTICSFFLNKKFTFGGAYSHQKLLRFTIVAIIGFMLNLFIMFSIVNVLDFHYLIGELVTILIIPFVNFCLNHYWTFK
ncbi:GtrA family protein [Metabacillus halosaccharovorans]|uniref:GtrA family protein n=1 Tax=Metabacillus halosaccharovorans TaxID=930124 RepID=UPI001C1FEDB8|nr:GtrA family protein [Metabacillus halosaccharovorans]MBU7592435.1 GtrA family protein [Metabacillus halosaccharovorans]